MENKEVCEKCVAEQLKTKSAAWWIGMIDAVVAVVGVLMGGGRLTRASQAPRLYTDIATAIIRALKDSIK